VSIDADGISPITLVGPGAGGEATASAVVADLGDIARGVRLAAFGRPAGALVESRRAPMQRHEGGTIFACSRWTVRAPSPPSQGIWPTR